VVLLTGLDHRRARHPRDHRQAARGQRDGGQNQVLQR
jgi:hypothetical protein